MLANASPGADSGQGKKRLSSVERRQAIVEAAVELFAQRGFRGTTTRELAAAVGVTEPILYQHFATKRDLYNAIVDWVVERKAKGCDHAELEALSTGSDDRAFFRRLGMTMLEFTRRNQSAFKLVLYSALEGHKLSEIWQKRMMKEYRCFVEGYLERRMAEGALRPRDPEMVARAFLGMVGHYGMMTLVVKGWETVKPPEEAVTEFVEIFLHGIKG